MTITSIRDAVAGADGISSRVHAEARSGPVADLAESVHALCAAMRELTTHVQRLERKVE